MFWKVRYLFCVELEGIKQGKQWLKFFQNSQGLQINIERSLKNDASESLNSFVKSNYKTFTNDQLYLAYIKRDLSYDATKIVQLEMLDRSANQPSLLSEEQLLDFLDKNLDFFSGINYLQASIFVLQGKNYIEQMTFNQILQFMKLQTKIGYLHEPTYKRFVSLLKIDDQFIEQFTLMTFKHVTLFLDTFSNSPYEHGLQPGFLDYCYSKYIQKLNNYEIVAQELVNIDLSKVLLPFRPTFINESQFLEIKIAYAKIFEKAYNKNYSFITSKQTNTKEIAYKILLLYQPDDFHLLQNSLPYFIKTALSTDQKIDQVFYQLMKYFKYFSPQLYFQALNSCQKQNLLVYNSRIDIRLINSLIQNNCLQGFRSILQDHFTVNEAEMNIKKLISTYLATVSDSELLNFEDIFSQNMELDIDYEFQETEISDLSQFIQSPKQIASKESSSQNVQKSFVVKMQQKFQSLQSQLIAEGFVQSFGSKSNKKVTQLEPILYYIDALSIILTLAPEFEVQTTIFYSPLMLKLIERLHFLPNFFESIVQISQRWPKLFSPALLEYIRINKQSIDDVYNSCKTPQNFIDYIESEISKYYTPKLWRIRTFDRLWFSQNLSYFNFLKAKPHQISNVFYNFIHEYTLEETFINNPRNRAMRFAQNSDTIIQHTHLKELIWQSLQLDNQEWKMNYSDFPHLVDFICLKQKIVVFLEEYPRLIRGLRKVHTLETKRAVDYYNGLEYQIVFLDYSEYHPDHHQMLNILKQKFVYRYN